MFLCAATLVLGMAATAKAVPVQYAGTGNYYEVIGGDWVKWATAYDLSDDYTHLGETSYFADIHSQGENDFIHALVAAANADSAWIGGYQQQPSNDEPSGGWSWTTGAAWTYDNWAAGEPNDWGAGTWRKGEDVLEMYTNGYWNDNSPPGGGVGSWNQVFVVEYNGERNGGGESVPEPATVALLGIGLVGLAGAEARRRRRKKAVDKI